MQRLLKERLVLGIAALTVGAGACSGGPFRSTCQAIKPGELVADVAARLESDGGGYVGKLGQEYHWTRSTGIKTGNCLVADDKPPAQGAPDRFQRPPPDARVTAVKYVEGHDLL